MINEAIILTGGVGSRMQGSTLNQYPKGLVFVKNKPLLYWCMKWLGQNGVRKVVLATGHLSNKIEEYFGNSIEINAITNP